LVYYYNKSEYLHKLHNNVFFDKNKHIFERDVKIMNIWKNEESSYTLNNLTSEDINKAEKHFRVKLPKAYLDILMEKNGGTLLYNALPISLNRWEGDDFLLIEYLFGIKENEGIMETDYYVKEWEINRKNIILLSGDGHQWIALDYNNSENPKVIYIDTEEDKVIELYSSFDEMIENLFIQEENEDDDVSEGVYIISLEEARKLVRSNDFTDIQNGLDAFEQYIYDENILEEHKEDIIRLLRHDNEEVVTYAAQKAWSAITMGYNVKREFINYIISDFENRQGEAFKSMLFLITMYLNENEG